MSTPSFRLGAWRFTYLTKQKLNSVVEADVFDWERELGALEVRLNV